MSFTGVESLLSTIDTAQINVGIFDESHRLKSAAIWGPVGAEAVLAQALPEPISLFYQSFDVPAARAEGLRYTQTLQDFGVTVVSARDSLAGLVQPRNLRKDNIVGQIISSIKSIQEDHGTSVVNYADQIVNLVEDDIQRYGEDRALALNSVLCLDAELPMGNTLYSRDQMNVLLQHRVSSVMAKPIRRPEVALYELVYEQHLVPHSVITLPMSESFEGGDAYIHNGFVFVGVGARTSFGAALKIYEALKPDIEEKGLKFAIVEDSESSTRSFTEQQDFMHLDTFSNPIGKTDIAVCLEEAQRRRVRYVDTNNDRMVISPGETTFIDFLERLEDAIVIIPREEQKEFGCNFLLLGQNREGQYIILVPLENNTDTNNSLLRQGKIVTAVDLKESTRGYGAAHCMTGQIQRLNLYE